MIRSFTLLSFIALAIPVLGEEPPVQSPGALKLEFDIQRAELSAPLDELDRKYAEQLDQLLDQVASVGNLE